jgi:UDP-N-acetylmuramoyl-tripeptide--D-alanyl-D-alanine ligase
MRTELEAPLSLSEVADAVGARCNINSNRRITAICTDTREAQANDLFIALNGENESGESYVSDALRKGCFVISSRGANGILKVNNTRSALLKLAEYYKSAIKPRHTVAVTGSVGKSTTVKFLKKILSQKYKVHIPYGNYNNDLGVPLTVLSTPQNTEVLVVELGMNHAGEISRLSRCVHPDIGIITSIGSAHIGNLGSRENIAKAKLEIRDGMSCDGILIIPENEPLLHGAGNSIRIARDPALSEFALVDSENGYFRFISPTEDIQSIRFFDLREHLISDLALAIAAAQSLGMSGEEIINGVSAINHEDLRQRFILLKDFTIFDDAYNASLESVIADLKFISTMNKPTGAFLGDMLELGDSTHEIHRKVGYEAARLGINRLYLYGDHAHSTKEGALSGGMNESNIHVNEDILSPDISVEQIRSYHAKGEIILFKASHSLRIDKIADTIRNKEEIIDE